MGQKEKAKKYNYLQGETLGFFIGRVPSNLKMEVRESHPVQTVNGYGKFTYTEHIVSKTRLNGTQVSFWFINRAIPVLTVEEDEIKDLMFKITPR